MIKFDEMRGFALGNEEEILFDLVILSEVEGRQGQKDWNGMPARTPKSSFKKNYNTAKVCSNLET